jgi:hypothetical protein
MGYFMGMIVKKISNKNTWRFSQPRKMNVRIMILSQLVELGPAFVTRKRASFTQIMGLEIQKNVKYTTPISGPKNMLMITCFIKKETDACVGT